MDLFSVLTDELSAPEDLEAQVKEICEFASNLNDSELKIVQAAQSARDFELWERGARAMQGFAYQQGLKEEWWRVVSLVKEEQAKGFWTPAWDAAFDHSVATLLKPWAGKSYSMQDYEILTEPLRLAGFQA